VHSQEEEVPVQVLQLLQTAEVHSQEEEVPVQVQLGRQLRSKAGGCKDPEYLVLLENNLDASDLFEQKVNDNIGFGIYSKKSYQDKEFILEYRGDLVTYKQGSSREKEHEKNGRGSFLYFFKHQGRKYWGCLNEETLIL